MTAGHNRKCGAATEAAPHLHYCRGGAAPADGRCRQASTQDTARRMATERPAQARPDGTARPNGTFGNLKRHIRHPKTARIATQNGTYCQLPAYQRIGTIARQAGQSRPTHKEKPVHLLLRSLLPATNARTSGLNSDYKEKSKYNTPLRRTYPMLSQKAGPRLARNIELKYHKVLIYFSMARRKDTKKYFKSTRFCLKIFLFRKYFSLKARFRQPNTRRWSPHRRHFAPS